MKTNAMQARTAAVKPSIVASSVAALLLSGFPVQNALAQSQAAGQQASPPASAAAAPSFTFLPQDKEIELALSAGPEHLRQESTVYVFGKNGYEKIRSGKNGFHCLVNRDGQQRGEKTLRPTCWDAEGSATILPVMLRVGELLVQGKNADEVKGDIDSGFSAGRFSAPRRAGIAYMLRGDIQIDPATNDVSKLSFPPHYMVYAPSVSNADIGMVGGDAAKERYALPFIYAGYSGGAHTAYIIILATEGKAHVH
jgi:hypothetical protein